MGEFENDTIYRGTGWGRTPVGEFENGTIYRGTGWGRTAIGEADDRAGAGALLLLSLELI